MLRYFLRRLLYMVSTLVFVSVVAFVLIQLPPGDFITTIQAQRDTGGGEDVMSPVEVEALRRQYGLDRPFPAQYLKWVWNIVSRGDLGFSMEWNRPVNELIGERIALTTIMAMMTTLFIYAVAIPLGVYSALHQYSPGDFAFTALGYAGLATPELHAGADPHVLSDSDISEQVSVGYSRRNTWRLLGASRKLATCLLTCGFR